MHIAWQLKYVHNLITYLCFFILPISPVPLQASEWYISSVLAAVGEQRAEWLLRLSPRQCLVLALDTSQSMALTVAALRQLTARLAQLEPQLRPGCFVLVPFSGAGQWRDGLGQTGTCIRTVSLERGYAQCSGAIESDPGLVAKFM